MKREITSEHLMGATELTVVMDVKPGFIPLRDTISYATRLRFLLRILNRIRKKSREALAVSEYLGPIERLRTIQFVRFSIFDNDTKLLLAVAFDKPWEPYIRTIHQDAGPILDAICCHCVGYSENHRSELGFAAFSDWVRKNQVGVDFFYAGEPSLTSDDLRYLKLLEAEQRKNADTKSFDEWVSGLRVSDPVADANQAIMHTFETNLMPTVDGTVSDEFRSMISSFSGAPMSMVDNWDHSDFTREHSVQKERQERLVEQGLRALVAMHSLTKLYPNPPPAGEELDEDFWRATAQSVLRDFDSESWVPEESPLRQKFAAELGWFETRVKSETGGQADERAPDPQNIQGNILTPYQDMTHGCLMLMQVTDPTEGRSFLLDMVDQVSTEASGPKTIPTTAGEDVPGAINLAITRHGLESLGLSPSHLAEFPKEFREGMERRAGLLGDTRDNHPDHWNLPKWNWPDSDAESQDVRHVRLATVDIVVQVQAAIDDVSGPGYYFDDNDHILSETHPLFQKVGEIAGRRGVQLLSTQTLRRKFKQDRQEGGQRFIEEHFGFADGISQPKTVARPEVGNRDQISYGEVLLGYRDDRGDCRPNLSCSGDARKVLVDGSFLVVRKLHQHVSRFNAFLDRESVARDIDRRVLQGKLFGRYPDGEPLVSHADLNDFDYSSDEDGKVCPLQSHIRRTNPRTVPANSSTDPAAIKAEWDEIRRKVPRIVRRGFSYGPRFDVSKQDDEDRGLFFMAYNANIAEQFEAVQRWVTGGNSTGALSTHDDPILGVPPQHGHDRTVRFLHGDKVIRCWRGSDPFVTLDWGMYLFAPSISGLQALAGLRPAASATDEGEKVIRKLQALERIDTAAAAGGWKGVVEERSAMLGGITAAVWAAIRAHHDGALLTPYGLLVGSYPKVMDAFRSTGDKSVRKYWYRMKESIGEGFLGMDPEPQSMAGDTYTDEVRPQDYQHVAEVLNPMVAAIDRRHACNLAFGISRTIIDAFKRKAAALLQQPASGKPAVRLNLKELGVAATIGMCRHWFGVPDASQPTEEQAAMIENFTYTGRHIFASPNPSKFLEEAARTRGSHNLEHIRQFVRASRADPERNRGVVSNGIFEVYDDDEFVAKAICGLSNGLVAPTLGSFLSTMAALISTERLWRLQQYFVRSKRAGQNSHPENVYDSVRDFLEPAIISAMRAAPVPNLVYRTATSEINTASGKVQPGTLIVLSIESAARERGIHNQETDVLFGGDYRGKSSGTHACPGRDMGIGAIVGMISAVLDAGELSPVAAPLTLWIDKPKAKPVP